MADREKPQISASLMCADLLHLGDDLEKLAEAGTDYLHFDIMDGHFVPNIMLSTAMVKQVRRATSIPFDIHLMVEDPERIIPMFDIREGDYVSVHCESTNHISRALAMVRERGARAMLALNPGTPISVLTENLYEFDAVLVMTVNPGYAGQKLVAGGLDKIVRVRRLLDEAGRADAELEVDGNCSLPNAVPMYNAGARIFVSGSSGVFKPEYGIVRAAELFREAALGKAVL